MVRNDLHMEQGANGRARQRMHLRRAWTVRLLLVALLMIAITWVAIANFVLVDVRLFT